MTLKERKKNKKLVSMRDHGEKIKNSTIRQDVKQTMTQY